MESDTALKFVAWGIFVASVLQAIFYFVFQVIGYDLLQLSVGPIISVPTLLVAVIAWRILAAKTSAGEVFRNVAEVRYTNP